MAEDEKKNDLWLRDVPGLPGCWQDVNENFHFSVPEIHAFFGLPDSPDDRAETMQMMSAMLREYLPRGAQIIMREKPNEYGSN